MFFKRQNISISGSLSSLAWKKFKKNKIGMGSLLFIGAAMIIALLGYLITSDSTPYANDQYLELGLKKPGFTVEFLPVTKKEPILVSNPFQVMWY
ncbi:MAG: ABC transporter permease, partial [Bacteroidota bacterium]